MIIHNTCLVDFPYVLELHYTLKCKIHTTLLIYVKDVASLDGHGSFNFNVQYLITIVYGRFIQTLLYPRLQIIVVTASAYSFNGTSRPARSASGATKYKMKNSRPQWDSNPQPSDLKSDALPTELAGLGECCPFKWPYCIHVLPMPIFTLL